MRFIRLQGLFFVSLIIFLFCLLTYLVLPSLSHYALEKMGSKAVGAKVEIRSVDISYWPFSIALDDLTVADPDTPMRNLFEVEYAVFSLELFPLLFSEISIESLIIKGLILDSQRASSGALEPEKVSAEKMPPISVKKSEINKPSWQQYLPDAQTMLTNRPLKTDQAIKNFEQLKKAKINQWSLVSADLPKKAQFAYYQKALQDLRKKRIETLADINELQQTLRQLKRQFDQDKAAVKAARVLLNQDKQALQDALVAIKRAPSEDFRAIIKDFSVNQAGLINVSQLLFGDKIKQITETVLTYYSKLWPIWRKINQADNSSSVEEERLAGRWVHFANQGATPFIIKGLYIDLPEFTIPIKITARDLTFFIEYLQRPMLIEVSSMASSSPFINATLAMNYEDQAFLSSLALEVNQLPLQPQSLLKSNDLSVSIREGQMNLQAAINTLSNKVNGQVTMDFKQLQLLPSTGDNRLQSLLAPLTAIHSIKTDIAISGNLPQPKIKLDSDLDEQFNQNLSAIWQAQRINWEQKIKDKLYLKIKDTPQYEKNLLSQFTQSSQKLDLTDKELTNLVKSMQSILKEKQQNQVENKIKKQLNKWF